MNLKCDKFKHFQVNCVDFSKFLNVEWNVFDTTQSTSLLLTLLSSVLLLTQVCKEALCSSTFSTHTHTPLPLMWQDQWLRTEITSYLKIKHVPIRNTRTHFCYWDVMYEVNPFTVKATQMLTSSPTIFHIHFQSHFWLLVLYYEFISVRNDME